METRASNGLCNEVPGHSACLKKLASGKCICLEEGSSDCRGHRNHEKAVLWVAEVTLRAALQEKRPLLSAGFISQ